MRPRMANQNDRFIDEVTEDLRRDRLFQMMRRYGWIAVLLILASGLQRRPRGLLIGTALQVPLLLTGLINGAMWIVGGVFVLIWLYLLQIRKELLGSTFGDPGPRQDDDAGTSAA